MILTAPSTPLLAGCIANSMVEPYVEKEKRRGELRRNSENNASTAQAVTSTESRYEAPSARNGFATLFKTCVIIVIALLSYSMAVLDSFAKSSDYICGFIASSAVLKLEHALRNP
uniref:Uncharacterized protein n=1 Tax=Glossina pallidipes TaxID=7398 RepID=A0A1A9ZLH9_GLOPL